MSQGITPLMRAVYHNNETDVEGLLEGECLINAQSSKGSSALMIACAMGHTALALKLLGMGANYHLRDNEGLTCWDHALGQGHHELVELQERYAPTMGTLWMMRDMVLQCESCELALTRTQCVYGEGNPHARVVFVGEGPGESEDKLGRPFVGVAGKLLTKMIEKGVGIPRHEVYIANIVKCRPPRNRVPVAHEALACRGYLEEQIHYIAPKLIVALGATALTYLLDKEIKITHERGKVFEYKGIPLLATYHPSYLLRNPLAKKESYADMLHIRKFLAE